MSSVAAAILIAGLAAAAVAAAAVQYLYLSS
jgi:hypothetical protein